MAIIASTLATIKSAPLALLGGAARVNECFAGVGHRWRAQWLDPARTMKLFILQVLHGNAAISQLRHLSDEAVADSSYCEARTRLPVAGVAAAVELLCGDDISNNQKSGVREVNYPSRVGDFHWSGSQRSTWLRGVAGRFVSNCVK